MSAQNPSENWQVLPGINPDAYVAAAKNVVGVPAIDTTGFRYMTVVLNLGDLGSSAVVTIEVQSSLTSGGTYADFDASPQGAGATIIIATDATDDNTVMYGTVDLHTLPAGEEFVKLAMTIATATSDFGAVVILSNSRDTGRFAATTPEFRVGVDIT